MQIVDPLRLVMLGDLTDTKAFCTKQTDKLGVFVDKKSVQHLTNRRNYNGAPDALIQTQGIHIYSFDELEDWFYAYVLTHPRYYGGLLQDAVRKELKTREQSFA